jgi:hypothetical protein
MAFPGALALAVRLGMKSLATTPFNAERPLEYPQPHRGWRRCRAQPSQQFLDLVIDEQPPPSVGVDACHGDPLRTGQQ